ncbi:hypothetical protein EJ05DRAFT_124494 [Pseudovirgaria hyperparasitica]|uniref:Uncharacterized protein n=1 Tax=Pseudovirgaria hyperparasitica TaxID=470096 RepID=A0A6A6VY37_9PEZI|nr:uncharacterized protein EJ05DRAFT_124494 [Pseudovirgaria hyperparasitica]KAF2755163.1 hypothetical protein EJ05DRAFT_124494 [Pseudovirgaria hyperparasitica]
MANTVRIDLTSVPDEQTTTTSIAREGVLITPSRASKPPNRVSIHTPVSPPRQTAYKSNKHEPTTTSKSSKNPTGSNAHSQSPYSSSARQTAGPHAKNPVDHSVKRRVTSTSLISPPGNEARRTSDLAFQVYKKEQLSPAVLLDGRQVASPENSVPLSKQTAKRGPVSYRSRSCIETESEVSINSNNDSSELRESSMSSPTSPTSEDLLKMFNVRTDVTRSKSPSADAQPTLDPLTAHTGRFGSRNDGLSRKRASMEAADNEPVPKRMHHLNSYRSSGPNNATHQDDLRILDPVTARFPSNRNVTENVEPSRAPSSRLESRTPLNLNVKSLMREQVSQGLTLHKPELNRSNSSRLNHRTVIPSIGNPVPQATRNVSMERVIPIAEYRDKFTREDCVNIVYLKEVKGFRWSEIQKYFPFRTFGTLQSKYCKELKYKSAELLKTISEGPQVENYVNETRDRRPKRTKEQLPTDKETEIDSYETLRQTEMPQASIARPKRLRQIEAPVVVDAMQADAPDWSGEEIDIDIIDSIPVHTHRRMDLNPTNHVRSKCHDQDCDCDANCDYDPDLTLVSVPGMRMSKCGKFGYLPTRTNDLPDPTVVTGHHTEAVVQTVYRPYLPHDERQVVRRSRKRSAESPWSSDTLHEDFYDDELKALENGVAELCSYSGNLKTARILRLSRSLRGVADDVICSLVHKVKKDPSLRSRTTRSIECCLRDLRDNLYNYSPTVERLSIIQKPAVTINRLRSFVRQRELGHVGRRNIMPPTSVLTKGVRNLAVDTLSVTTSFTGLGSDVNVVAWDPEGTYFAAGAVCTSDPSSMQYNRPLNLLLGSMEHKTLRELPDHHTLRQRTEQGANSTHAMYASQDPRLFSTISGLDFSANGKWMYSSGYDKKFRIWDVHAKDAHPCQLIMEAKERIDLIARHPRENLVATGSHRTAKSIKVIQHTDQPSSESLVKYSFASPRAIEKPKMDLRPSSLKFESLYGDLLLAGFASHAEDEDGTTGGQICVWDVISGSAVKVIANVRDTLDCSWSPRRYGRFAVGHKKGSSANRATRSEVRIYDFNQAAASFSWSHELENSYAKDINDVVFCPYDDNYIASGCTDGTVYVWDIRRPDSILYRMKHDKPLLERSADQPREDVDEGVRFLSWGPTRERLYSGASDGVVRVWDITQPVEQVFVKKAVTMKSGIMCGAFTADKDKLLLGEVNGTITVLEALKEDYTQDDIGTFGIINAPSMMPAGAPEPDSGIAAARDMIKKQTIVIRPLGGFPVRQAVQGPAYTQTNLLDTSEDAPALRTQAEMFQRQLAHKTSTPCNIPACRDAVPLTSEEFGDSSRWRDRIPIDLRHASQGDTSTLLSGLAKCSECGAPARPRANVEMKNKLVEQENGKAGILCERCDFSCFRCGDTAFVSQPSDFMSCPRCDVEWSLDALGYNLKREGASKVSIDFSQRRYDYDQSWDKSAVGVHGEVDDLINYYQSLWIDRPESPPL